MKITKKNKWFFLFALCFTLVVVTQVFRHYFIEEERQTRINFREAVLKQYPEAAGKLNATYGLRPFTQTPPVVKHDKQATHIILVHGLDEPGKVWMNLAPVLAREGFPVWIMTYPNDQPISESAQFFLQHLETLYASGIKSISIAAHSMGGLVTREMLTQPALSYADKVKKGELPNVRQLIMVGTPNHGSELARFRIFTEFRDQLKNMFNENYHFFQVIFDGAGEAGLDLIPGSTFLKNLNSRAHPANVDMLVIAGVMTPQQKKTFEDLAYNLDIKLSEDTKIAAKKIETMLLSTSHLVGDGMVSVDSARLPGIPIRTVQGTHLSMIRNIRADSQRVPPSIPIIVDQFQHSLPKR